MGIPIALIALVLIAVSRPANEARPAPMDYRGLVLIVGGGGLSVFGLQQASLWGWASPATLGCIAAGAVLLGCFLAVERRTQSPLINVRIFANRTFAVENAILGIAMMVFVPLRPARRPDARPGRGEAAGGARVRAGGGRLLPVGREGDQPATARRPVSPRPSATSGPAWASPSSPPSSRPSSGRPSPPR